MGLGSVDFPAVFGNGRGGMAGIATPEHPEHQHPKPFALRLPLGQHSSFELYYRTGAQVDSDKLRYEQSPACQLSSTLQDLSTPEGAIVTHKPGPKPSGNHQLLTAVLPQLRHCRGLASCWPWTALASPNHHQLTKRLSSRMEAVVQAFSKDNGSSLTDSRRAGTWGGGSD